MKIICALLLLPLQLSWGALEWAKSKVELQAKPTDDAVEGVFPFKNTGSKEITILQLVPSCGCTTAKLDKKTYAAGESGEIVANFKLGGRIGPQLKTITVLTDDAKDESKTLELSVDIADPLITGPAWIDWKVGGDATVQEFPVKVKEGFQIKITEVKTSNDAFAAELKTIREGSDYLIKVRPKSTTDRTFGLLIIGTDYPAANPRVVYAQLRVQ